MRERTMFMVFPTSEAEVGALRSELWAPCRNPTVQPVARPSRACVSAYFSRMIASCSIAMNEEQPEP